MDKDFLNRYREEIMKCTNCGFCQAACPIFGVTLRPAYNTRGKMLLLKEFMEARIDSSKDLAETFYTCTTCQACTQSCPRRIKASEIVEGVRRGLYEQGLAPAECAGVQDSIVRTGNVFGSDREERIDLYPPPLRERIQKVGLKGRAETLVFMGCLPSYLDMKTVPALVQALEAADIDYTTLAVEEICCGFPLYLIGSDQFEHQARLLMEKLHDTGARELITPCAGCYKTFSTLYPEVGKLDLRVYHTVQYLDRLVQEGRIILKEQQEQKITYHDPCDLGRACQIFEEPRNLLKGIPGFKVVEMTLNRLEARCCGGGGNLQSHHPEMALEMAARRVRDALEVGAEIIVSGCPACKDNLRKGARLIPKEERGRIKVIDICEAVSDAMVTKA